MSPFCNSSIAMKPLGVRTGVPAAKQNQDGKTIKLIGDPPSVLTLYKPVDVPAGTVNDPMQAFE